MHLISVMNGGVIKVGFAEEDNVGMIMLSSNEHRELAAGCTHSGLKSEILLFRRTIKGRDYSDGFTNSAFQGGDQSEDQFGL